MMFRLILIWLTLIKVRGWSATPLVSSWTILGSVLSISRLLLLMLQKDLVVQFDFSSNRLIVLYFPRVKYAEGFPLSEGTFTPPPQSFVVERYYNIIDQLVHVVGSEVYLKNSKTS